MRLTLLYCDSMFRLVADSGGPILPQSDWDFPKAGSLFGFVPCPVGRQTERSAALTVLLAKCSRRRWRSSSSTSISRLKTQDTFNGGSMNELPFYLTCLLCDAGSDIASKQQAIEAGWTRIEEDPEECPSCYIGICPACRNRVPRGRIRLACMGCDRNDYDEITPEQLAKAIQDGWQDVSEEHTFEESCQVYELGQTPLGRSIMDWWTHLGWCPDCAKDRK
jgi:hypothetical protein